jgi:hypothetical protein
MDFVAEVRTHVGALSFSLYKYLQKPPHPDAAGEFQHAGKPVTRVT